MSRNIYTVPSGTHFLNALARAILNGDLPKAGGARPDPLHLSEITLLLPTRRAARAARDAFLAASGARAMIMPRIRPISEGEDDQSLITALAASTAGDGDGAVALDLPPPIPPLHRTLILMQLVHRWRQSAAAATAEDIDRLPGATPAQAAQLAAELGKLMDDVERENVSLDGIAGLVSDNYSEHWQKTVDFLKIVTEFWPAYLEAGGLISPEARRNALIHAEAKRIAGLNANARVIVAGVTGSIPATVELMRAVAARPGSAIVLPALDQDLDDESWRKIVPDHPEHPQFGLAKLLAALGLERRDVAALPGAQAPETRTKRAVFFSEAMRPAATTEKWHSFAAEFSAEDAFDALSGVSLIEAPTAHDEAEAVSLILREAVETPGRTAALVSPDRVLARRVAVRLESWGIRVDDSAGRPFAKTVPGTLLALAVDAIESGFAPAPTIALLKHPLCRLELDAFDIRRFARALEIIAFRAPYLGRGLEGIANALDEAEQTQGEKRGSRAASRLWAEDRAGARMLVERLITAFAPLAALYNGETRHSLAEFSRAHAVAAEAICAVPRENDEAGGNPLWQGEAGEAASLFFTSLTLPDTPDVEISADDYRDLYTGLLARENVRERTAVHPRISIWGPFEARLQQPDVLILGSLNEGTWPEAVDPGAWLNRPMRQSLGLPAPEEEIGRAAHDFVSLTGAPRVYMTRAEKSGGDPKVASRWLMRVKALLTGMNLDDVLEPDKPWLAWARARDTISTERHRPIGAPEPKPPVAARPRRISATEVERWISNPYAIFARHILKLEVLPQLGSSPEASMRGGLVHEVLAKFATAYPEALPDNPRAALEDIASGVLAAHKAHPRVAAFWMPRLGRFLDWFSSTEPERRGDVRKVVAEISGALVLDAPGGAFTLTARADRIDDDGTSIIITDYKTGGVPANKAVLTGSAPQLPLEAAIALGASGFPNLAGRSVGGLRYIRAAGGEPPGEQIEVKAEDIAQLAEQARSGLAQLVAEFDNVATPYRAIRRPSFRYDYDDYAHLARVAEWSAHVEPEADA